MLPLMELTGFWVSEPGNMITIHVHPNNVVYLWKEEELYKIQLVRPADFFVVTADQLRTPGEESTLDD